MEGEFVGGCWVVFVFMCEVVVLLSIFAFIVCFILILT